MSIGSNIIAWRRYKSLSQKAVAIKSGLTQPYISRLEKGEGDPSLSSLRSLALAFEMTVGQLVDERPPQAALDRHQLDQLARGAIRPGTKAALRRPETRVLARLLYDRRKALGLYVPHRKKGKPFSRNGLHAARWLRSSLGETQWNALLQRIDKLASQV